MPNYRVYLADRNQFGGGGTLLVDSSASRDQFLLPNVVRL
jgi:hypothetical protein